MGHGPRSYPGAVTVTDWADNLSGVSQRAALLRDAYDALGRGELGPWMGLLDPAVIWRAVDRPEEADPAPT
jgi:hypothetical protein